MSTLADDPAPETGSSRPGLRVAFRAAALCASLLSLYLLWTGERARVDHDLQLFAEPLARPGETLALRALLLEDVEAIEGPHLGRSRVLVRLLDPSGRELARSLLSPAITDSMEGLLRVPEIARGVLRLEASLLPGDEQGPRVWRRLEIEPDAPGTQSASRLAGPLQHFSVGRVITLGSEPAPSRFAPRVVGGSCVPEVPCQMLVWVGEPAAAIEIKPSAALTLDGKVEPAQETSGLVALNFRVHGAEAEAVLQASRAGKPVAERAVRLPLALGEARIDLKSPLAQAGAATQVVLTAPVGREHVIIDTFVAGRWARSSSEPHVDPTRTVALPALGPEVSGLVRLQARSDRYSAEGSGTRVVYQRRPGETDAAALAAIAALVRDAGLGDGETDSLASALPRDVLQDPERWAAYMLSPLEMQRMPIPLAVSGRPTQLARVERLRTSLRFGVGGLLVLSAILVGASLLRHGLHASQQAAAIMEEADQGHRAGRANLQTDQLRVVGWVVLVCLAFLAAALLVVAKPLWF